MFIYAYRTLKYKYKIMVIIMPVIIDTEKCGKIENCPGEGLCIKICEKGALEEKDGDIVIIPEKCDNCDLCMQNCPNQAISKE
jgi:ferredoxin